MICSSAGPHAAQGQSNGLITPLFLPSPSARVSVFIHPSIDSLPPLIPLFICISLSGCLPPACSSLALCSTFSHFPPLYRLRPSPYFYQPNISFSPVLPPSSSAPPPLWKLYIHLSLPQRPLRPNLHNEISASLIVLIKAVRKELGEEKYSRQQGKTRAQRCVANALVSVTF